MKIFVDSADIDEIKESLSWGIVDGITTNPSLIKKAIERKKTDGNEIKIEEYIEQILRLAEDKPVSLEVNGEVNGQIREERMIKEARNLYNRFKESNKSLNIKIPVNPAMSSEDSHQFEGLRTIKKLKEENIPVNATLIMTPEQSLLAAKAGAKYLSPFMGRIDDFVSNGNSNSGIKTGVELMKETMKILKNYNFDTEVIGASIRNIQHVRELGKSGVQIATIPFKLLKEMITHEKTYEGVKQFKEDVVQEYGELLSKEG